MVPVLAPKYHSVYKLFVIRCRHGGQTYNFFFSERMPLSKHQPNFVDIALLNYLQDEAQMVADRLAARTDGLADYEELYRLLLKTPPPQVQSSPTTLSLLSMTMDARTNHSFFNLMTPIIAATRPEDTMPKPILFLLGHVLLVDVRNRHGRWLSPSEEPILERH